MQTKLKTKLKPNNDGLGCVPTPLPPHPPSPSHRKWGGAMLLGRGGVGHLRHFDWAMDVLQIGWVGEGERGGRVREGKG